MLQFRAAASSHVGLVRSHNEDSGFAGPYLLVVADGVGGAAAGEVASATATYVATALSMLSNPPGDPVELLAAAVDQAGAQLRAGIATDPSRSGMSTTLTAIATDGVRCAVAQVGDSRAYLRRDGIVTQLTTDHTLVQALVESGRLTAAEARVSPHRNIVVRALGGASLPEPDLALQDLVPGDRLLLCSDGLNDYAEDDVIADLLGLPDREEAVAALIEAALLGGGRDNVTVLVADVVDEEPVDSVGTLVGAVRDASQVLDPTAVR